MAKLDRRGGSNLLDVDLIAEIGGDYVRYNNGVQICWGIGSSISSNGDITVNFGRPFLNTNYSAVSSPYYTGGAQENEGLKIRQKTTTSMKIFTWKSRNVEWIAIGKWK